MRETFGKAENFVVCWHVGHRSICSKLMLPLCYLFLFFFSSRRRHTRLQGDWSSDVCSSDLCGSHPAPQCNACSLGNVLPWPPARPGRLAPQYSSKSRAILPRKLLPWLFPLCKSRSAVPTSAQPGRKQIPQHEAGTQQARLHAGGGDIQSLRRLVDTQMLHIAQHKNFAIFFSQRCERFQQFFPNLVSFSSFRRNLTPIGEIAGRVVAFFVRVVNDRLYHIRAISSEPHPSFVHSDLNQPSAEPRLGAKLPDMFERFQQRFLGGILCIGFVAQNRKRGSVHAPLVGPNQFIEQLAFAILNPADQLLFWGSSTGILQRRINHCSRQHN